MTDAPDSQSYVATGLTSLDSHVEGEGFLPGSILGVRAPAHSVGRQFVFNLCADRPVHYVALGHDPSRFVDAITTASAVSREAISTERVPLGDPYETLEAHLDGLESDLDDRTTVIVDPITPVESLGDQQAASAVRALRAVVDASGGLGVVLALSDAERASPSGRWVTLSQADAVLSILHETTEDGVHHHLAIDRLPAGQRFRNEGDGRVFELPPQLDMTLDTSKSLSP